MTSSATDPPLHGLALVGGRSTRMREDKATLQYHGVPQAVYSYNLLAEVCAEVFISCRAEQAETPAYRDLPQIHDSVTAGGPMAGILSAMDANPAVAWLVLACDLPFVDRATLDVLVASRDSSCIATAYRSHSNGLPEPLAAIYEPSARAALHDFLADEVRCPRKALIRSNTHLLDLPDDHALANANSPEEYRAARDYFSGGPARRQPVSDRARR